MNTKNKILLVALSALVASFLLVKFVFNKENIKEKQKITIGTFSKSMGNVPFYIAKEKGWFEKAIGDDYEITYAEYNDRPSIASALSSGSLKFIFSAEIPAILIEAQGEDIEFENLSATLSQEIIVSSSSKMVKVSDLKGKKIAVLAGTSSHYALLKILEDNGLSPKDVSILFMPPAEAKVAFENKSIDAWAVWPPWVEQQQVTGFARSLTGSNAIICSVGYMPYDFIKSKPFVADSLSNIINRAKEWILNNPEESQLITAKQLDLDIKVVKLAWTKFNWSAKYDKSILDDIQKKAKFLSEEKLTRDNILIDVNKDLIGENIKE
jgi:sulfonate transport system substrate-binding protein